MKTTKMDIQGQFETIESIIRTARHMGTKIIETSADRQIRADGQALASRLAGQTGTAWVRHGAEILAAACPAAVEISVRPALCGQAAQLTAWAADESEIASLTYHPEDSDQIAMQIIRRAMAERA